MSNRTIAALRAFAWERAKGELYGLIGSYGVGSEANIAQWKLEQEIRMGEDLKRLVDVFVSNVEKVIAP